MTRQRILMIAFHFPPMAVSSGIQRTLRFVRHLPGYGWDPIVLSAHPRAYVATSDDLLGEIPADCTVRRAFALDAARHLAIGGRYPGFAACPDRWVSWRFDAVRQGMQLIREFRPDVIWSTYPIATAHLVGRDLARRSGLPWVADFRDPMAQDGYPTDPKIWNAFRRIEEDAMREARLNVFTTPGAARLYSERYPHATDRITVIENGYDEESFAEAPEGSLDSLVPGAVTLLHSGIVYPAERDPTALFVALGRLAKRGAIRPGELKIRFRAAVHDDLLAQLAKENGVEEFIELCPSIPYRQALGEMLRADGLLVLQAGNCNDQIPAKIYEYLRADRPIVCLTDPSGDTATTLRSAGIDTVIRIESADAIEAQLPGAVAAIRAGTAPRAATTAIRDASREGRARRLAESLASLTTAHV